MKNNRLTVIILTYNEELHLQRCIDSLLSLNCELIVVDSFSTDLTINIANKMGALVFQNPFISQAQQFQWALDNCPIKTKWVMRMDADEFVTPQLQEEIALKLDLLPRNISGVILNRQVHFMGRWIKHGGYYPTKLLRIWRNGDARIEQRWMDEHMVLTNGVAVEFDNDIVDYNLNNLSWWTQKHNNYSTREAIDILNNEYNLFPIDSINGEGISKQQDSKKRWYKENLYLKLPPLFRAFLYFLYRFFIKLGFLDGKQGVIWHFLQGFWYRFLVDSKVYHIKRIARDKKKSIIEVIEQDYNFKI